MKAIKHPDCNAVLRGGAPHIPDLHVRRGNESEDGAMPVVASYWKPTADELADLAVGGAVEVVALGLTHPPLSIRVATSAEREAAQALVGAVPQGWRIRRLDALPFEGIELIAPNGHSTAAYSHARNPENILYMLADALLWSPSPATTNAGPDAMDASRYRWLREHTAATGLGRFIQSYRKQFLDEAIDAAMASPDAPLEQPK